ncbi:hypothetical protein ACGFMK_20860 [Amycolatopsis sp. NPDC049252]|uniref:hypothetical protein n=1 Tax=Amycolatopsis sp. NPDC049252 TaxID=3363933 RepID=UPI00372275E7
MKQITRSISAPYPENDLRDEIETFRYSGWSVLEGTPSTDLGAGAAQEFWGMMTIMGFPSAQSGSGKRLRV